MTDGAAPQLQLANVSRDVWEGVLAYADEDEEARVRVAFKFFAKIPRRWVRHCNGVLRCVAWSPDSATLA